MRSTDGRWRSTSASLKRRASAAALTTEITERVLDAGGRFYFAKDAVLTPDQVRRAYGEERGRRVPRPQEAGRPRWPVRERPVAQSARRRGRMIVVTGGAGFIGSALVWALNQRGIEDVVVADYLGESEKWRNLVGLRSADYRDKLALIEE